MSSGMLIRHCAPTLAGIKTGNLFSCACPSQQDLRCDIRRLNQKLVPKGIRVIPLRCAKERALIYVYRPSHLGLDLSDQETRKLLRDAGYQSMRTEHCVLELIRRLNSREEFPHEIGLFLGYPPEDVQGFIQNKAENCKCVGCWKVYGDEKEAKKQFERYEKCTKSYRKQWEQGVSVEQLAVGMGTETK